MLQQLVVAVVVVVAFGYSAWALMPAAWRRGLRRRLGLQAAPAGNGCAGCGADGCGAPAAPHAAAVVQLHRRPPHNPHHRR